jgi:hypothetical protein
MFALGQHVKVVNATPGWETGREFPHRVGDTVTVTALEQNPGRANYTGVAINGAPWFWNPVRFKAVEAEDAALAECTAVS